MKQVREYYKNYDEEGRLERSPAHKMEFIIYHHDVEDHLATCQQPSLLGYSLHGLYICRKK